MPQHPGALRQLLTNCTKPQPNLSCSFFFSPQHSQGHLDETLHLETCSECPNEAPFPDFEQLPSNLGTPGRQDLAASSLITGRTSAKDTHCCKAPTSSSQPQAVQPPQTQVSVPAPSIVTPLALQGRAPTTKQLPSKLFCYEVNQAQAGPTASALKPESQQKKSAAFSGLDLLQ